MALQHLKPIGSQKNVSNGTGQSSNTALADNSNLTQNFAALDAQRNQIRALQAVPQKTEQQNNLNNATNQKSNFLNENVASNAKARELRIAVKALKEEAKGRPREIAVPLKLEAKAKEEEAKREDKKAEVALVNAEDAKRNIGRNQNAFRGGLSGQPFVNPTGQVAGASASNGANRLNSGYATSGLSSIDSQYNSSGSGSSAYLDMAVALLGQIGIVTSNSSNPNPVVQLAKNLTNKGLSEQAITYLEAALVDTALAGTPTNQIIILRKAQASTLHGEAETNLAYWKEVLNENKQLEKQTHDLAKRA